MKKFLTLMIAAALMISFTACEKDDNGKDLPNILKIGDRTYEIGAACCYWGIEDDISVYDLWFTNKKLWNSQGNWELPDSEYANGFEVNIYNLFAQGATRGEIASGKYTYSTEGKCPAHDGLSDYGFYDENGNFGDYIEIGQGEVEASNLVIEIKHINGTIYEIKFTGGVDERGNSVNGYYKGEVDIYED